jgi:hypothetical protein
MMLQILRLATSEKFSYYFKLRNMISDSFIGNTRAHVHQISTQLNLTKNIDNIFWGWVSIFPDEQQNHKLIILKHMYFWGEHDT